MLATSATAKPVLDFRAILKLQDDDRLDGHELCLGGAIRINLAPIEQAFLEADAAGLTPNTPVLFKGSLDVGVVTERNTCVTAGVYTPARYPVMVHSTRGLFEYSVGDVIALTLGTPVVVMTMGAEVVEGLLTAVDVQPTKFFRRLVSVTIDGRTFPWKDVVGLERLPSGH